MEAKDRSLMHKLAIALVVKLVVLSLLWWFFVHEHRVPVTPQSVATQMLGPANALNSAPEQE